MPEGHVVGDATRQRGPFGLLCLMRRAHTAPLGAGKDPGSQRGPEGLYNICPKGALLLPQRGNDEGPLGPLWGPLYMPKGPLWGNDSRCPKGKAQRGSTKSIQQHVPRCVSLSCPPGPYSALPNRGKRERYALSLSPEGPGGGSGTRIPRKAGEIGFADPGKAIYLSKVGLKTSEPSLFRTESGGIYCEKIT